jgi:hypothetical protein
VFREYIHAWMGGGEDTALRAELMVAAVVTAHNYVLRRRLRGLVDQPEAEFGTAMAATLDRFAEPSSAEAPGSIVAFRTTKSLDAILPTLRARNLDAIPRSWARRLAQDAITSITETPRGKDTDVASLCRGSATWSRPACRRGASGRATAGGRSSRTTSERARC